MASYGTNPAASEPADGSASHAVKIPATESSPLLANGKLDDRLVDAGPAAACDGLDSEIPLLHEADTGGHGHGMEGGTTESAVFNLSNTIIGAGIMGLPSVLKVLGIPLGLLTLILLGALSEYSLQRLLTCTMFAKAWSFGDLMATTYGRLGRNLLRAVIIIHNIGILIVYMLIIGDVLCGSDSSGVHYSGILEEWGGGAAWWNSRAVVLSIAMVTIMGPLASLPHIDSLQFTSGISIALAIVFVAITIVVTILNLLLGKIDFSALRWMPPGIGSTADIWQLFSVIPSVAVAFTCHYNLHPIFVELHPPREQKMRRAVKGTLVLCTSTYCVIALFGYMLFGNATYSDVLANFDQDLNLPYSEVLDDVVRIFYAFHLMLVFPVIHFSLRASVDAVMFPRASPLASDVPRLVLVTAMLLGSILVLSLWVPNVQFAFQFVGAAGAATLAFTLPGLVAVSDKAGALTASPFDTSMAVLLLTLGIGVTITGLTSNLHTIIKS